MANFPRKSIIKYVVLFILSVCFLLIFSLWTSPIYKGWYGCDASFFTMAGRGILSGWIPYKDFFDLKGPYFFFFEALGQLICKGRFGAFWLQCLALFASLVLIERICNLLFSGANSSTKCSEANGANSYLKKYATITGLFLFMHIATLWGGNTLEEYLLPLSLLCVYMVIRSDNAVGSKNSVASSAQLNVNMSPGSGLVIGICFGIMMFSKITIAAPIVGLVIGVVIISIKEKEFEKLMTFCLYGMLGFLIAITPIFIYFGIHKAIYDMLYSCFIFAFKRSVDFSEKFNLRWELKISPCYFAIVYAVCQMVRRRIKDLHIIILCMGVVTAICLHLGVPFIYYFTTCYPVLIITLVSIFIDYEPIELFKHWSLDVPLLCLLIALCYYASHSASTLNTVIYDRDDGYYMDYVNSAKEMASLIPENDRDSVYSINMDMQWFEITQILPCYSYTINLQFFVALDKQIEDNIINKLETDPPKWIVAGDDLFSYLPNISTIVDKYYTEVYSNDFGHLLLLER